METPKENEHTKRGAVDQRRLVFAVDRDDLTNGIQLAIEDDIGGFRIKGPKYNGSSTRLLTAELSERDAREIRRYLDKYFPSENRAESAATNEAYPQNWKHCTIHLNPDTGEMHSDGDHSVRHWIMERIDQVSEPTPPPIQSSSEKRP